MTRGLSSAQASAMVAPHRQVMPLVELYFTSGTLMFALGPWDLTTQSGTYIHTGALAYVKPVAENAASQEGIEVGMSGLDTAVIAIACTEPYRGKIMRLLKGYIDPGTNLAIGEPVPWFIGRMTTMTITEDNTQASVAIQAEHYELELTRPSPIRWNDADQQRLHPGDLGCQYAAATAEKIVIWPSKKAQGG